MQITKLKEQIYKTMTSSHMDPKQVISACNVLSEKIKAGIYDEQIRSLGLSEEEGHQKLKEAAKMLSAEFLHIKVKTELGTDQNKAFPLGVLFHIGAGNAEGLSAYSIIEGLLTGNINIVKLSKNESGASVFIIQELFDILPLLKEYVYLFEFSSSDKDRIKELASLADAVVIWGGDKAIQSIRTIVDSNCRLIEWGHKISFAYINPKSATDNELANLALHIIHTNQLLCSSCQGIYIDCSNESDIDTFSERFLRIMEQEVRQSAMNDYGWSAKNTLQRYTYELERLEDTEKIFKGRGVNLFYRKNPQLEAALGFGNLWIKALPRTKIIETLKESRGYLQTVGLICDETERRSLAELFIRAGLTSIRQAGDMSAMYEGEGHDGDYPLRRYSKIVDYL